MKARRTPVRASKTHPMGISASPPYNALYPALMPFTHFPVRGILALGQQACALFIRSGGSLSCRKNGFPFAAPGGALLPVQIFAVSGAAAGALQVHRLWEYTAKIPALPLSYPLHGTLSRMVMPFRQQDSSLPWALPGLYVGHIFPACWLSPVPCPQAFYVFPFFLATCFSLTSFGILEVGMLFIPERI